MKKFEYKETELAFCTRLQRFVHLKELGDEGWELVSVVTDGWAGSNYRLFWKRQLVPAPVDHRWDCPHSPTGKCDYLQTDNSYDEDSCRYCGQPDERK